MSLFASPISVSNRSFEAAFCNSKKADGTTAQAHIKLRKEPVRPACKPIYADRMNRVKSWSKFISEAYCFLTDCVRSHGADESVKDASGGRR
jgi:hypothetical protein